MKSKIIGLLSLIVFVFLGTSGIFEGIANFMVWLVTLNSTQSEVSMVGEIFVKVATFAISFIAVRIIFNALAWFDSDAMKIAYFIISTIISFVLCYVVMLLETYIVAIAIVLLALILIALGPVIFLYCRNRRNNNAKT